MCGTKFHCFEQCLTTVMVGISIEPFERTFLFGQNLTDNSNKTITDTWVVHTAGNPILRLLQGSLFVPCLTWQLRKLFPRPISTNYQIFWSRLPQNNLKQTKLLWKLIAIRYWYVVIVTAYKVIVTKRLRVCMNRSCNLKLKLNDKFMRFDLKY